MSIRTKSVLLIALLLVIDQWSKIYVKTHFMLGESVDVFSWFKISFIENEGAAFGMQIVGKLFLTLFRIAAIVALSIFIHRLIKRNARAGYILVISVLLAGAVGNLVDSLFYGVLFSESTTYAVATFMPEGGGYAPFLYGKVVDMFYFPLIETVFPDWVPIWGGQEFVFFRPIFNLADSAICVGVFLLLIFYRHTLSASLSKEEK